VQYLSFRLATRQSVALGAPAKLDAGALLLPPDSPGRQLHLTEPNLFIEEPGHASASAMRPTRSA
jgi:hypothetical protein